MTTTAEHMNSIKMDDRYLFRAKRHDNDEWITGNLIQVDKPTGGVGCAIQHGFKIINDVDVSFCTNKVNPETIGQCTGLKDKNNNLIFEGDIVLFSDNPIHENALAVCVFLKSRMMYAYKFIHHPKPEMVGKATDIVDSWRKYEVIGNIHDNPKLLEVRK